MLIYVILSLPIGDVKPPELKFTSTPYCEKSYDNASISWTFNENAYSTCMLKTSLSTKIVICDKSWSGTFLPEGNVTLEITATDNARNVAPVYKYTWYNSKCISLNIYKIEYEFHLHSWTNTNSVFVGLCSGKFAIINSV